MALTPKSEHFAPLKSEEDLDKLLKYHFSNLIPGDSTECFVKFREYDLTADQIMELGKEAGYKVKISEEDSNLIVFS